jgi:hypothetical protein
MIRVPFNRPFATREEIDYIRAAIATPKFCFTTSCVLRATRISRPDSIDAALNSHLAGFGILAVFH